ncbi:short transient receptor potential channel 3-like isoform X1 [Acanthaster planci]|uniref:Short transient receptor potential channel 3-like isoform X1 n=1 Tax=Acanthaster planci TaxID=133434 RepID=A0A8B7ZFG9_ACAPL|nr:short transient receptor potential channel 3-like isoform X1 [Acanthaster planci]
MPFSPRMPVHIATRAHRQGRDNLSNRAPQGLHAMRRKAYDSVLASLGSNQHEILDEDEVRFLQAVEFGDLPTTRAMLERPDIVSRLLKCTDYKDRTCLEIATENEHLDIVEHLIRAFGRQLPLQCINESLMLAISKGYLRITQTLLTHPMFQKSKDKFRLGSLTNYFQPKNNSKFDQDITPIMLAAHCNEIDIIRLLLHRGDSVKKPHHSLCECTSCYNKRLFDPLKHSLAGIHAYRALASPAYISLTSRDPILSAFLLSQELMQLSKIEKEFKNEYRDLAKQCKKYASDLLDMCQNSQEVRTILNQRGNTMEGFAPADSEEQIDGEFSPDTETTDNDLARLRLAIKYYQKQFVAHPHCQHQLATMWYDGFPGWRRSGIVYKILITLLIPLCLPFLAIAYWVAPTSKLSRLVSTPLVKFITHTASYLVFLIFIFLESTLVETYESPGNIAHSTDFRTSVNRTINANPKGSCAQVFNASLIANTKDLFPVRFSSFTIFEWIIVLFVVGTLWAEIKQIWEEGYRRYLASIWNWLDIAMLNFYMTTFSLKFCSYHKSSIAINYFITDPDAACDKFLQREAEALEMFYFVRGDRHVWDDDDPILLAEALFAIANVLSFSRMSYVLPVSEFLGPLQISLGRMLGDIVRFAVVFGVVFMAFFCSLYNLYWSYDPMEGSDDCATKAGFGFGTFDHTFLTLFWALFGLAQPDDPNIPNSKAYGQNGHQLTAFVGTLLFSVYFVVMGLVMLNMLIAMMSNSFQEIESDQDVEWKFARSQLWLSYFERGATLPIPFNLIPSPKSFVYAYKWLRRQIQNCKKRKQQNESTRTTVPMNDRRNGVFNIMNQSELTRSESILESTMKGIVRRYLFKLQREKENDEVNEGELDEIKNDISSLRFELMEQLRKEPKSPTTPAPVQLTELHLQEDAVKSMSFHIACVENKVENLIEQMDSLRKDLLTAVKGKPPPPSRIQYI